MLIKLVKAAKDKDNKAATEELINLIKWKIGALDDVEIPQEIEDNIEGMPWYTRVARDKLEPPTPRLI